MKWSSDRETQLLGFRGESKGWAMFGVAKRRQTAQPRLEEDSPWRYVMKWSSDRETQLLGFCGELKGRAMFGVAKRRQTAQPRIEEDSPWRYKL